MNPNRARHLRNIDVNLHTQSHAKSASNSSHVKNKHQVLYWMFRELRTEHNWGLLHAQKIAKEKGALLGVIYTHVPEYARYSYRHYHFQIESMKHVHAELKKHNIPMYLLQTMNPDTEIINHIQSYSSVSTSIVIDFLPVREFKQWTQSLVSHAPDHLIEIIQVDGHNIVPAWIASNKLEYAARTIRPKITGLLPQYLESEVFGDLEVEGKDNIPSDYSEPDWEKLEIKVPTSENTDTSSISSSVSSSASLSRNSKEISYVPSVDKHFPPGAKAAHESLNNFLSPSRLGQQATKRNDPNAKEVGSRLSPYINFGIISAQYIAQRVNAFAKIPEGKKCKESIETYLEEMIVRRELSDNFCLYQENYDNMLGCASWAKETLLAHANDKRKHVYTFEQLENSKTYDDLWNAAQTQMRDEGLMHGFLRMYWAKKILEWTESPMVAIDFAIRLNDKYSLDGNNNPNGFVGCMWSICGIHDQGWAEREIFGKIRYMNLAGCKRKFDVPKFISKYSRQQSFFTSNLSTSSSASQSSQSEKEQSRKKSKDDNEEEDYGDDEEMRSASARDLKKRKKN